ncbi:OmpH family outer membrane protein [Cardinium endosymbiont of Tipula unca]|uniref:OmpH family outer membrane protein n=1 Tax=Cardinium endosymbiont of Tipula unca TaxID=3066216 RepID=UPI0030CC4E91
MNYKFLYALALTVCAYTGTKADDSTAVTKLPETTQSALKIGYVDLIYVLDNLPEAKKNNAEIQSFQKQLENQVQAKYKKYQEKAEAAQQQMDTLTEAQKKQKYSELSKLQSVIQELDEQRYAKMERKYKEVMAPLQSRVQEVINKISEEHHYSMVFNKITDVGPIVLFAQKALDISDLIVEELKKEAPKEVAPPVVGPQKQAPSQGSAKKQPSEKKKKK